jgi:hypothetical protein
VPVLDAPKRKPVLLANINADAEWLREVRVENLLAQLSSRYSYPISTH